MPSSVGVVVMNGFEPPLKYRKSVSRVLLKIREPIVCALKTCVKPRRKAERLLKEPRPGRRRNRSQRRKFGLWKGLGDEAALDVQPEIRTMEEG
jgi:hypothetical protein